MSVFQNAGLWGLVMSDTYQNRLTLIKEFISNNEHLGMPF